MNIYNFQKIINFIKLIKFRNSIKSLITHFSLISLLNPTSESSSTKASLCHFSFLSEEPFSQ